MDSCETKVMARGWCAKHYARWDRTGDPETLIRPLGRTDSERFWEYVRKTDGCWIWDGGRSHTYGSFFARRSDGSYQQFMAHRWAYEESIGPIPTGMTLDHLCHTAMTDTCRTAADCPHRLCVRPDHLAPLTLAENISRGGNGAKTHCKHGHEFTSDNTGPATWSGPDARFCRTCKRADGARLRARRRAAA